MGMNMNGVFYATTYHPIQAGSIDGTDITAHDNGVYRALLGSATGLYDPLRDPKAKGDPYCSLFVGRLSAQTDEKSLREAMSRYGRVKNLRLVRHIVTGASCGYAFIEFETEKEMKQAYEGAHQSKLDGATILVDYNRQQLMPGWIPRRLGGGLGGKKESGQLRFGGRDRPFRAPLRPIPYEELQKLGIPIPPEGRYMTRFQVPPPPQRIHSTIDEYDGRSNPSELKHQNAHSTEEDELSAKEFVSSKNYGSGSREVRERDRHRRHRDDFRDRGDRDYDGREETSSSQKPGLRDQESTRESKYEGFKFEHRRSDSRVLRDELREEDSHHHDERDERKLRREVLSTSYDLEEVRYQSGRWQPQDGTEHTTRSDDFDTEYHEKKKRRREKHVEKPSYHREVHSEKTHDRHDNARNVYGRHHKSRHRREESREQSDHIQADKDSENKHRHSDKHRRRDRDFGSLRKDEGKSHKSHRKHKHRERSAGENLEVEQHEREKGKH